MKNRYFVLICFLLLLTSCSFVKTELWEITFERDGNIYVKDQKGKELQLTFLGKDTDPVLSPNKKQVIFVRQIEELKNNPWGDPANDAALMYTCWSPDEIWTVDSDGKTPKVLVKSHYGKSKENKGWFSTLNFSPDGRKIYYVCQPACPTTFAIRSVNSDGTDDKWIRWGQSIDVIGGSEKDRYYGYLVVQRRVKSGVACDIFI